MNIYTIHAIDEAKLAQVKADMADLGAPILRVVDCGEYWVAVEGMHRLRAACELGLAPQFEVLAQDEPLDVASMDICDMFADGDYTAGDVAGECYHAGSGMYVLGEDGTLTLAFEASI